MRRFAIALALTMAGTSCGDDANQLVRARVVTDRSQLVGGPAALADVGDFVLENDQIRVAILGGAHSVGPGVFGGSLIDADLRRREDCYREGRGLDQFGETFPVLNLSVPEPGMTNDGTVGPDGKPTVTVRVTIKEPGSAGRCPAPSTAADDNRPCAIINVTGGPGALLALIGVLQTEVGQPEFDTDYIIRPGDRFIEIVTNYTLPGSGTIPEQATPLSPIVQPASMIGTLLGENSGDPAFAGRQKGVIAGDMTIFGKKLSLFAPGVGFDEDSHIIDRIFTGEDTLKTPAVFDLMAGIGDSVSYGFFTAEAVPSRLAIPFFTGSITFILTHAASCMKGDEACQAPLRHGSFRRYFAIGEGDVGSLLETMYRVQKKPHGKVSGAVVDRRTGAPISHADVFAVADPLARPEAQAAEACKPLRDAGGGSATWNTLLACLSAVAPADQPEDYGIVSHMQTDRGTDPNRDGNFTGPLPPGRYWMVARTSARLPSDGVLVTVTDGGSAEASLAIGDAGRVVFDIQDESGARMPGKITFVGLTGCDPAGDERCDALTGSYGPKRLYFNDSRTSDGISEISRSLEGFGDIAIEPGRYRVRVSHGIEYSIEDRTIDVKAGSAVQLNAKLQHLVDSKNWISADFHVHASPSFDSGVPINDRIRSFITDGVELLSSSDHDVITNYAPYLRELGMEEHLGTEVGLETTTLEIGHFIGFPMQHDVTRPAGGAFDWVGLVPREIFANMRKLALPGSDFVVMVPHPRDGFFGYFDQYGLDPMTLGQEAGLFATFNSVLKAFDDGYDSIEIINGKRWDFLRTPSVSEIAGYNADRTAIITNDRWSAHEKRVRQDELAAGYVKRVITRTPEEQKALRFDSDDKIACAFDDDCPTGTRCNPHTLVCATPGPSCMPGVAGMGCAEGLVCDPPASTQYCMPECKSSADCRADERCLLEAGVSAELRGTCAKSTCDAAQNAIAGEGDRPCSPVVRGVVDDWFRLLNYGVAKTGVGNSDTHDIDGIEAGSPRNYVCSSTDKPNEIDPYEIARNVKQGCIFTTYGPFVDFTINEQRLGSMVSSKGAEVNLHVRVQTPGWFDVTRVEIYRNGDLLKACDATHSCAMESTTPLVVPNTGPVALDLKFTDTPPRDAWYLVIVLGDGSQNAASLPDGAGARTLSPVQTSNELPNLAISELLKVALADATLFGGFKATSVLGPLTVTPQVTSVQPYAITNPIWVDTDGNGKYDPASSRKLPWKAGPPTSMATLPHPLARLADTERGQNLVRQAVRTLRRLELNASHGRFK